MRAFTASLTQPVPFTTLETDVALTPTRAATSASVTLGIASLLHAVRSRSGRVDDRIPVDSSLAFNYGHSCGRGKGFPFDGGHRRTSDEGVTDVSGDNGGSGTAALRASRMESARPRPQLVRSSFHGIDGEWGFAHDDAAVGRAEGWFDGRALPATITVPFPPESEASGIHDTGFHPVVWYRRELTTADLAAADHRP